ncbi:amino acid adenylation domain protein (plasmid) [Scytonema sp. HK-05]|uniref:non-ribosomal peptide synthetase n=1 Tax=Scytonema sp. HK-05 TaxID=1137095 RepID=UPI000935F5B0|nr:non-ribosomal peptide synthetase [Scytonema sp. HK-05]OKH56541.1 non-ribosomal peptide synthetase [Scytonema sp. HK-05]BAY50181.1 amino acid adenylation domain protein [Scytonema sp. HK-05]
MSKQNKNVEAIYPLSPMQQGMLFHTLYAPNSGMYFEQLVCTLHGNLNVKAFHGAWQRVVERYQILRTLFIWEQTKQPLQVVCKSATLPWFNLDWQELSLVEQQQRLEKLLQAEREKGFKLDQAPLMRCTLIKVGADTYQFIWSHHHLLMDGWCLSIVLKEVLAYYEAAVQGENLYLTPPHPYKDYIAWLQQQDLSQSEAFWRQALQGFTNPTPLITDKVGSNKFQQEHVYKEQKLLLPKTLTSKLESLAKENHLTLNTLLQGTWALLLNRYSGESDVLFGTTVSGRPSALTGVESMVGLFINTLPVRLQVSPAAKLLPWLKQLQAQLVDLEQYAYTPLVDIQAWSDVPRGTPLFESLVVFENYPLDASLQEGSGSVKVSDVRGFERTNYPLTVVVTPGEQLSLQVSYNASRFNVAIIKQMLEHLETMLADMVAKPQASLLDLEMISQRERQKLLIDFNDTKTEFPENKCIHQLFESQVERTPNNIAVEFDHQHLTYRELNTKANQLAHQLQKLGVGPEVLVGICVERSLDMVIGILGILKAGGAYVPFDPTYPTERLGFMLEDAQISVMLTQQRLAHNFAESNTRVICLDTDLSLIATVSIENPPSQVTPQNLAYIIYTSGSTGKPKGTMIPHRGVVNYLSWCIKAYAVAEGYGAPVQSSIGFDATITSLFSPLLVGQKVVLLPEKEEIEALSALLQSADNYSLVKITPAHLQMLNQMLPEKKGVTETKALVIGGEALLGKSLTFWRHHAPNTRIINEYGPTETVVGCCVYEVSEQTCLSGAILIGRPIANTELYLLDENQKLVPIGVVGELYIGGAGVARGYLNRPQLTQQRFIPNPFSKEPGSRLYKTGDLARYLPDGNLEYLGRIDHQVKIRGLRIELEEIESLLGQHPLVNCVTVIAREDQPGDKRLVGYIVPHEKVPTTSELRRFLKEKLPEYMVPSAFVMLDALPITPNGKIDRRALPVPETFGDVQDDYQAPRSLTEEVVATVWLEVLGAEVGVNVNFFEAGGHSLLATQVISRLQKAFAVKLPLQYLFEYPTIAELSECIDKVRQGGKSFQIPAIEPVSRTNNLPLSFAQQRLWFLDQLEGGSSTYNVPAALQLTGSFNPVALEQSLRAIVQRHEVLRTTFSMVNGYPVQVISPSVTITLPIVDLRFLLEHEQSVKVQELVLEAAQQPFDLANEPLLRATLLRLDEKSHILLLVMHHIVCDGWSMGIFLRELSALYAGFVQGVPTSLEELPIQYADFAYWQHQWLQGEVMEAHLSYWKQQLANLPTLELPTDRPRPASQTFRGTRQNLELPKDLSEEIKALSRREGTTLFMTLMAAFNTLLHSYVGQDDIVVGTDVANRNRLETEGIIGFFVNQLVLRTDLSGNPTFRDLLARVRQVTMDAYDHQDMPFDQLVAALNPERDLSRTPLFQSKFVLQNAPMPAMELEDLTLKVLEIDDGTAKFDLLLTLWETEQGLTGNFEYSTNLFNTDTIERMLADFETILRAVIAQPNTNLQSLKEILLAKNEQKQLIKDQKLAEATRNKLNKFKRKSA